MPFIPIVLPPPFGGVSRQAGSSRFAHQVEEADNCLLTITRGAEKRAGSWFIPASGTVEGDLDVAFPIKDHFIHFIERDIDERFILLIDPTNVADPVEVYDLNGTKQTVIYADPSIISYLTSGITNPKTELRALTVTDATFILNRTKVTALKGAKIQYQNTGAGDFVHNKSNTRNVKIWENITQPATNADVTSDPFVPTDSVLGYHWYLREDSPGHFSGFYRAISSQDAPWYERVRTEAANSEIDETTMPVRMDFDGVSTFTISFPDWVPRLSGDPETNPGPSFIGKTISDITFFENRLWFASEENVVSSQSGDFFNLWIETVEALGDSDPVDVQTSTNAVTDIDYLIAFEDDLIIMTKGARQFRLFGDQRNVTPLNASFRVTSRYRSNSDVPPVTLGNQLYFVSDKNSFAQVYEYFFSIDVDTNVALDVTLHADTYIPNTVEQLSVSENNDFLFLHAKTNPNILYSYKVFWAGNEKKQEAWSRWIFDPGNEIIGHHVFDNDIYIVFRRNSKIWLEKISIIQPTPDTRNGKTMPYALQMDRQYYLSGVYDQPTDSTLWTLPFNDPSMDEIVLGPEWDVENRVASRLDPSNDSSGATTILSVSGNWSQHPVYAGRSYEMNIELSQIFFRDNNGQIVDSTLQLNRLLVRHRNTGYYEVHVTPTGRETQVFVFTAKRLGGLGMILGQAPLEIRDRPFVAPIQTRAAGTVIELKNDTPVPTNIVGLTYRATVIPNRSSPAD